MKIDTTATVGEIAATHPDTVRVFQKLGIDFCCGGKAPLAEACNKRGVTLEQVLADLNAAVERTSPSSEKSWSEATLQALIGHIVDRHHTFTREELARLRPLMQKVIAVHGGRHAELATLGNLLDALDHELEAHLFKEENILFPYVVELENHAHQSGAMPQPMFGTVENPIRMMMVEHDEAGRILEEMRSQTSGFEPPADSCASFRALYHGLASLKADLEEHIHLENNVMFPRAIELERASAG